MDSAWASQDGASNKTTRLLTFTILSTTSDGVVIYFPGALGGKGLMGVMIGLTAGIPSSYTKLFNNVDLDKSGSRARLLVDRVTFSSPALVLGQAAIQGVLNAAVPVDNSEAVLDTASLFVFSEIMKLAPESNMIGNVSATSGVSVSTYDINSKFQQFGSTINNTDKSQSFTYDCRDTRVLNTPNVLSPDTLAEAVGGPPIAPFSFTPIRIRSISDFEVKAKLAFSNTTVNGTLSDVVLRYYARLVVTNIIGTVLYDTVVNLGTYIANYAALFPANVTIPRQEFDAQWVVSQSTFPDIGGKPDLAWEYNITAWVETPALVVSFAIPLQCGADITSKNYMGDCFGIGENCIIVGYEGFSSIAGNQQQFTITARTHEQFVVDTEQTVVFQQTSTSYSAWFEAAVRAILTNPAKYGVPKVYMSSDLKLVTKIMKTALKLAWAEQSVDSEAMMKYTIKMMSCQNDYCNLLDDRNAQANRDPISSTHSSHMSMTSMFDDLHKFYRNDIRPVLKKNTIDIARAASRRLKTLGKSELENILSGLEKAAYDGSLFMDPVGTGLRLTDETVGRLPLGLAKAAVGTYQDLAKRPNFDPEKVKYPEVSDTTWYRPRPELNTLDANRSRMKAEWINRKRANKQLMMMTDIEDAVRRNDDDAFKKEMEEEYVAFHELVYVAANKEEYSSSTMSMMFSAARSKTAPYPEGFNGDDKAFAEYCFDKYREFNEHLTKYYKLNDFARLARKFDSYSKNQVVFATQQSMMTKSKPSPIEPKVLDRRVYGVVPKMKACLVPGVDIDVILRFQNRNATNIEDSLKSLPDNVSVGDVWAVCRAKDIESFYDKRARNGQTLPFSTVGIQKFFGWRSEGQTITDRLHLKLDADYVIACVAGDLGDAWSLDLTSEATGRSCELALWVLMQGCAYPNVVFSGSINGDMIEPIPLSTAVVKSAVAKKNVMYSVGNFGQADSKFSNLKDLREVLRADRAHTKQSMSTECLSLFLNQEIKSDGDATYRYKPSFYETEFTDSVRKAHLKANRDFVSAKIDDIINSDQSLLVLLNNKLHKSYTTPVAQEISEPIVYHALGCHDPEQAVEYSKLGAMTYVTPVESVPPILADKVFLGLNPEWVPRDSSYHWMPKSQQMMDSSIDDLIRLKLLSLRSNERTLSYLNENKPDAVFSGTDYPYVYSDDGFHHGVMYDKDMYPMLRNFTKFVKKGRNPNLSIMRGVNGQPPLLVAKSPDIQPAVQAFNEWRIKKGKENRGTPAQLATLLETLGFERRAPQAGPKPGKAQQKQNPKPPKQAKQFTPSEQAYFLNKQIFVKVNHFLLDALAKYLEKHNPGGDLTAEEAGAYAMCLALPSAATLREHDIVPDNLGAIKTFGEFGAAINLIGQAVPDAIV